MFQKLIQLVKKQYTDLVINLINLRSDGSGSPCAPLKREICQCNPDSDHQCMGGREAIASVCKTDPSRVNITGASPVPCTTYIIQLYGRIAVLTPVVQQSGHSADNRETFVQIKVGVPNASAAQRLSSGPVNRQLGSSTLLTSLICLISSIVEQTVYIRKVLDASSRLGTIADSFKSRTRSSYLLNGWAVQPSVNMPLWPNVQGAELRTLSVKVRIFQEVPNGRMRELAIDHFAKVRSVNPVGGSCPSPSAKYGVWRPVEDN